MSAPLSQEDILKIMQGAGVKTEPKEEVAVAEVPEIEEAEIPVLPEEPNYKKPVFVAKIDEELVDGIRNIARKSFDPLTDNQILFGILMEMRRTNTLLEQMRNVALGITPTQETGKNGK